MSSGSRIDWGRVWRFFVSCLLVVGVFLMVDRHTAVALVFTAALAANFVESRKS